MKYLPRYVSGMGMNYYWVPAKVILVENFGVLTKSLEKVRVLLSVPYYPPDRQTETTSSHDPYFKDDWHDRLQKNI